MLFCAIAFMVGETVLWVEFVHFYHVLIARNFSDDRCCGNGFDRTITADDRFYRDSETGYFERITENKLRFDRQVLNRSQQSSRRERSAHVLRERLVNKPCPYYTR